MLQQDFNIRVFATFLKSFDKLIKLYFVSSELFWYPIFYKSMLLNRKKIFEEDLKFVIINPCKIMMIVKAIIITLKHLSFYSFVR